MNLPWMKFEASSWLIDTRVLSAEAKGVWIDILASMWQQLGKPNAGEPGCMTKTVSEFARLTGVSPETMLRVVHEFEENYICDVTWNVTPDVTPTVTSSVTILSRRMSRDIAEREGAAERKRRSRTSKNGADVSTREINDLQNVTAMSQQCHATEERRGEKRREEKKKEEHTHPAGARGEEQAGSSAPAPDAGLPELVESIVDARCDWVLRAGDVELELLKCPKALRAEAVRQFIADVVNAIDPPDRPLGLLRKYMQNADRYSGNAPGKNNGGGRYVKPGRGENDGPSGELPPPKMFDPENDPDREPDEFKPKPSKGLPQWIPPSERGDKVEAKSENEGGSK